VSSPGAVSGRKLKLFPTVRIVTQDSFASVPAELVSPSIAVVPAVNLNTSLNADYNSGYTFNGGFTVTRVASGRAFAPGQACLACTRDAATQLAATTIDWDNVNFGDAALKPDFGDQLTAVTAAVRLFRDCAQQLCSPDDQPCGACGMTRQHAPYCAHVVVPMVAALNAHVTGGR
jgi:hypothetical protein